MRTKLIFVGAILLGGCGHGLMRGSVVMKVSDTEAHVCMKSGELKQGEKVLLRHECNVASAKLPNVGRGCSPGQVAGTVEKTLNDHYSAVRFPPGTRFEEGDRVEAQR